MPGNPAVMDRHGGVVRAAGEMPQTALLAAKEDLAGLCAAVIVRVLGEGGNLRGFRDREAGVEGNHENASIQHPASSILPPRVTLPRKYGILWRHRITFTGDDLKFAKKWIIRLVMLVVALLVLLWLGRNMIAVAAIPAACKAASLDVRVEKVAISANLCGVGVSGLAVQNPAGFPEGAMLRMPEVYADCEPISLLTKTIQVRELRINVAEIAIVKNKDGTFNVAALMPPSSPGGQKKPARSAGRDVKIHSLDVVIGALRFTDYTKNPPTEKTVHVDLHEHCKDVTSPAAVGAYIVAMAAAKGIASGLPLESLALGGIAAEAGKALDSLGAKDLKGARDAIQGFFKRT